MGRLFLRSWHKIPNANGAIVTGREQRLPVRREGQSGDAFEMASQFGFLTPCRKINEADDSARAARTTHGQSPAIWRKGQPGKPAAVIGKCKLLPPLGQVPKPGGPVIAPRSQR